eukprot:1158159-Pelagomonas_calceolata.AAC.5
MGTCTRVQLLLLLYPVQDSRSCSYEARKNVHACLSTKSSSVHMHDGLFHSQMNGLWFTAGWCRDMRSSLLAWLFGTHFSSVIKYHRRANAGGNELCKQHLLNFCCFFKEAYGMPSTRAKPPDGCCNAGNP